MFPFRLNKASWAFDDLHFNRKEHSPVTVPKAASASANVNPLDELTLVSGNSTLTLETAVGCGGRRHTFLKTDAANTMTIACTGAQTVGGSATKAFTSQYDVIIVESNGTNWDIISQYTLTPTLTSLTLTGDLSVQGNTTLGNASGDALTIAPNAVTWSNNPTHSGNHTFSGSAFFTGTNTLFGTALAQTLVGSVPPTQIHGNTGTLARLGLGKWTADTGGFNIICGKSRNATIGTHTVVQNSDAILTIVGTGSDGAAFQQCASIQLLVSASGAISATSMPGQIRLNTVANGAISPTTALTIESDQTAVFASTVSATNLTAWTAYTPTRTGWTDVGTPTVTARYCQVRNVVTFQIKIVPATTVATVAGTSYVSLPTSINASALGGDGTMVNDTTFISIGNVVFDVANSRCYVPTQGATANTLSISGWYEV